MNKQEMKEELVRLTEENTKLTEHVKGLESSLQFARDGRQSADKVIEELHCLLDGIDLAPRRSIKDETCYSGKRELSLQARFTGFISKLIHRQFEPMPTTTIKEDVSE